MSYLNDLTVILPALIVAIAGFVTVLIDSFKDDHDAIVWVSAVALAAAFIISIIDMFGPTGKAFAGMITYGGITAFGNTVILLGSLFCVLISDEYLQAKNHNFGEVYSLILFSTVGMIALASANNLLMLFVGFETLSISLYILAGTMKENQTGSEAALKYFLLGAFASAFLLYGIALLYGATGSLYIDEIAAAASGDLLFVAGGALLLIGFLFKVSTVPFHMWTPDVYEGAPTNITAYFSTASKSAAFIALIIIGMRVLPDHAADWSQALMVISIITMIFGNIVAMVQDNIKRMLAYSSIAHAGYLLVGLVAASPEGYSGVLYYLLAYTLMNVGAFGVVSYYEWQEGADFIDINNYAGLGYKRPVMAILFSVFLFSLAGIPGFAGFVGKYYVFAAAIREGFLGLAILGVLASAASIYYYLRPMVYMYMHEPQKDLRLVDAGFVFKGSLVILAVLTIYFGIIPGGVSQLLHSFFNESWLAVAGF